MSISDPYMSNDDKIHERVFDKYGETPDKLGPCWGMDIDSSLSKNSLLNIIWFLQNELKYERSK